MMNDFSLFDILKLLVRHVFSRGLAGNASTRSQRVSGAAPRGSVCLADDGRVVDVLVQEPGCLTPSTVGYPMIDRNGVAWLLDDRSSSYTPIL